MAAKKGKWLIKCPRSPLTNFNGIGTCEMIVFYDAIILCVYIYIYTHAYIYIYLCMYACVCICVCVCMSMFMYRQSGITALWMKHYDVIKWNIFRVITPLWGEHTGHWWIPLTEAGDAELWCFVWSAPLANDWENSRDGGDAWDAIALIITSL